MSQIESTDGCILHYETDLCESPKGVVLLVHGFGDHCGRYKRVAHHFNQWGLITYRFDYRGHGRSEGRRGHVTDFQEYLNDVSVMRSVVESEYADLPKFLLSHSHGGLIALHSLGQEADHWSKGWHAVLSSPFLGIQVHVPLWKSLMGKGVSRFMPTFQMKTELSGELVSQNPEIIEEYNTDPLIGSVASARWFTEMLKAHKASDHMAELIRVPILFQLAGTDHVVSIDASHRVFDHIGSADQEKKIYESLFHEIWFDPEPNQPLQDLKQWIDNKLDA